MDVADFSGHRSFTGLRLDYRLRLWAPTSASLAISAQFPVIIIVIM